MANLTAHITTFNAGRHLIAIPAFAPVILSSLTSSLPPDLIVLSIQEIAPLGYSFLGGSLLAPYYARFSEAIEVATTKQFGSDVGYGLLLARNVGLTAIMVFARSTLEERIRWIETAGVGVGLWEMGNKGAVAVRLGIDADGEEKAVSFTSAHLAPMEDQWQRRNEDWKGLCQNLVFERTTTHSRHSKTDAAPSNPESQPLLSPSSNTPGTLFSPPTPLFLAGDLNYRTSDTAPNPNYHPRTYPQPASDPSDPTHYTHLLAHDQLTREHRANRTCHHLTESPIAFPPTYKYAKAAQKQAAYAASQRRISAADGTGHDDDADDDSDAQVYLWAAHRWPSWCDRILHLTPKGTRVHSYRALPVQPTSDHRPVVLNVSIPLSKAVEDVGQPFAIREGWREARAAARRLEVVVGLAAYLGLTWEGEMLLLGSLAGVVGGWLALRALLSY